MENYPLEEGHAEGVHMGWKEKKAKALSV